MALTYIETVRLLMGDLDEGDNNFFTGDQWAHLFGKASYDDADAVVVREPSDTGISVVSLVEVAIDALRILSLYHADARPERSKKTDDRVDALSRWSNEVKEDYLEAGLPDGIGFADAFRGPQGRTRASRARRETRGAPERPAPLALSDPWVRLAVMARTALPAPKARLVQLAIKASTPATFTTP